MAEAKVIEMSSDKKGPSPSASKVKSSGLSADSSVLPEEEPHV